MTGTTPINYYDKSVEVSGRLTRLAYYFIDHVTGSAVVEKDGKGNKRAFDEATNIAYAIANRSEERGDGSSTARTDTNLYCNFKAIMERVSPTYVKGQGVGALLRKELQSNEEKLVEKEAKLAENEANIKQLNEDNVKLSEKMADGETSASMSELAYRESCRKTVSQINKNNLKIDNIELENKVLRNEIDNLYKTTAKQRLEYQDNVNQWGDSEMKRKVNALQTSINLLESEQRTAQSGEERVRQKRDENYEKYIQAVAKYEEMVNDSAAGNDVTHAAVNLQGTKVNVARTNYNTSYKLWETYKKTLDNVNERLAKKQQELSDLQDEREEQETSADISLGLALGYFANYDKTDKTLRQRFEGDNDPKTETYGGDPSKVLDCRGQSLKFYYKGAQIDTAFAEPDPVTASTASTKAVLNYDDCYYDFWKLYDEHTYIKAVYDYCVASEDIGEEKAAKYMEMITASAFGDTYKELKACLTMVDELSGNPRSFYTKTLDDYDAFKNGVLKEIGFDAHFNSYANKTYYYEGEVITKYSGHSGVTLTKTTIAECNAIVTNSEKCRVALVKKADELLVALCGEIADTIRQSEDVADAKSFDETVNETKVVNQTKEKAEVKPFVVTTAVGGSLGRYETEAEYFQKLESSDPLAFKTITDKFKYFQPAYHSMSPEGFHARLTFLQQCCRQGHTLEEKAGNGMAATAGNLAFGRMPVCVLKLGDFINTRMIINSYNVAYGNDGMQWDLNPEGIGVQPMFAKVTMAVTLIGGQSLDGPVSRLQNAVSFDYYANTGVYDNRADRVTIVKDKDTTDVNPLFETKYNYIYNPMEGDSDKK